MKSKILSILNDKDGQTKLVILILFKLFKPRRMGKDSPPITVVSFTHHLLHPWKNSTSEAFSPSSKTTELIFYNASVSSFLSIWIIQLIDIQVE